MKTSLMLVVLLTLAAAPVRAIELSLEENKGEKGTIGFVDMDRVFREYPETKRAKEEFEAKSEADLLGMEKHRVQLLLGKLYEIVQQVAKDEGVSVVVDKKAILFGQKAVDLTDKLLEKVR